MLFKDKATAPAGKKFFSLFPGLGYAAGYKVRETVVIGMDGTVMLMGVRFRKEYTNMEDSHSCVITCRSTTERLSITPLGQRLERL